MNGAKWMPDSKVRFSRCQRSVSVQTMRTVVPVWSSSSGRKMPPPWLPKGSFHWVGLYIESTPEARRSENDSSASIHCPTANERPIALRDVAPTKASTNAATIAATGPSQPITAVRCRHIQNPDTTTRPRHSPPRTEATVVRERIRCPISLDTDDWKASAAGTGVSRIVRNCSASNSNDSVAA